ncbi:MAG: heat-inducible transcriptional repressor HrcA [Endomicrobium sp.]|jgi:heat-inducible transcriptional repressor|nr:heat-inducible transcriptional repressor HrcA [Endomicrobium sp.]
MRQLALEVLEKRKNRILDAVVNNYIKTGRPVSSNILIKKCGFSSSTIRSLMAILEKEGYLTHPHISAGRIPTDKGYRFYVDNFIKLNSFFYKKNPKITEKEYGQKYNEIEIFLSEISCILSGLSKYIGFVIAPKIQYDKIRNIKLIKISKKEILVILLTVSGMIKHKVIVTTSIPLNKIKKLQKFLNDKLKNISIAQANEKIIFEIKIFEESEISIFKIAQKIGNVFYNIQDDIYIDGIINVDTIVHNFNNLKLLKAIMRFMKIVNKDFNNKGINVKIGSENVLKELEDLSLISTVYENNQCAIGVVGIIGPKRMEYKKMILLVSHVSKILNNFFKSKK